MREKTLLEKALETPQVLQEQEKVVISDEPATIVKQEKYSPEKLPAVELAKLREKYKSEDEEVVKEESKIVSVIEKPSYDEIEELSQEERKKIFKINIGQETSQKPKRFKLMIVSLLIAIFGIWGIINVATIDSVSSQIVEVSTQYELNLANYLKNLYMLDATNSENMENLFETIPEEGGKVTQIEGKSNWFDRFCNFLSGLFGG